MLGECPCFMLLAGSPLFNAPDVMPLHYRPLCVCA